MIKTMLIEKLINKTQAEIKYIDKIIDSACKAGLKDNAKHFLQKKVMLQKEICSMRGL